MLTFTHGNGIVALHEARSLDMVFSDTPWMAGDRKANGHKYKDSYSRSEYVALYCHSIVQGAEKALNDGGTLAIWIDYRAAPYWGMAMDESGLTRCGEIIVESELGNPGESQWPIRHSNILLAHKGQNQKFNIEALPFIQRLAPKGEYTGDKRITSVIRHTMSSTDPERCGYPDQKPLYICKMLVEAFTSPGGVVFDPCCGSGSIPIAAHITGRIGIGFDLSLDAITVARNRPEARQMVLF